MLNFDNLQTPLGDGDILIDPTVGHWRGLMDDNLRRQDRQDFALAGVPVEQVRQATRTALYGSQPNRPVIAVGHQPAFIHPGVWAKQVVVRHVADMLDAQAVDFVVDNDSDGSSALQVPVVGSNGQLSINNITFTNAPVGSAYEGRSIVARSQLEDISRQLHVATEVFSHDTMMESYLAGYEGGNNVCDIVEQHLAGRLLIDVPLGADVGQLRVSRSFSGPFVADLLLEAERFAEAYNESLADYRHRQKVRSPDRPLPNLDHDGNRIETALWIYKPLQRRRRLWVERKGEVIHFYADGEHVGLFDRAEMIGDIDRVLVKLGPWVVRPRALTLMLWVRMLACDLFVHGIGGAKYDRITDGIFHRYYGCDPLGYTCVSATLRLPLPRYAVTWEDWSAALLRRRDLVYNPDRYLPNAPPYLLAERARLIQLSNELRERGGPKLTRWETFNNIRRINDELVRSHPDMERQLAEMFESLSRQLASNRIADSREFLRPPSPRTIVKVSNQAG